MFVSSLCVRIVFKYPLDSYDNDIRLQIVTASYSYHINQ